MPKVPSLKKSEEEIADFSARIHKRGDSCWELYTTAGNPHGPNTVPTWSWHSWKIKEVITHAAARLLGTSEGPLTEPLSRYDTVRGLPDCIRYCINPAHLRVKRSTKKVPPRRPPTPPLRPPPPTKDAEGNIIDPHPITVSYRRVYAMLDENKERQNRPKVNRPGFAGKH